MKVARFVAFEWDAIAGVIAATAAIVMHFLGIIDEEVLIAIAVVLIALSFVRDLRRERATEQAYASIEDLRASIGALRASLVPPDAMLIGPNQLRAASERFTATAKGDMIWFHVCLSMFRPQSLFDTLLKPAIENPRVTSIQFVLDRKHMALWESEVLPKIARCKGAAKVHPPVWTTIEESVSVIIADPRHGGRPECLLSFWGEPFMAHSTERDVPRFIFHVQEHSELASRLIELVRGYRFTS